MVRCQYHTQVFSMPGVECKTCKSLHLAAEQAARKEEDNAQKKRVAKKAGEWERGETEKKRK